MISLVFGSETQQYNGKASEMTWTILASSRGISNNNKMTSSVNFLDLTLTIRGGTIISSIYQKAMNLYLYLPFASAHPQGCIKGTVHSLIRRYYAQNSFREDYTNIVSLFYRRICARGWGHTFIRDLIVEASRRIENAPPKPPPWHGRSGRRPACPPRASPSMRGATAGGTEIPKCSTVISA